MNYLSYFQDFYFLFPILALASLCLFLVGTLSMAESKSIDIFILVQGSIIGHLFAQAAQLSERFELLCCYVFAALFYLISHLIQKLPAVHHAAMRVSFYAFLLISVFLFERWIPGIERHINSAFTGDLLFLNLQSVCVLGVIFISYLVYFKFNGFREIQKIFTSQLLNRPIKKDKILFIFHFLVLTTSTHYLGLSISLGFSLVFPLLLILLYQKKATFQFLKQASSLAVFTAVLSLSASFLLPEQSTSPLVICFGVLMLGTLVLFKKIKV